MKKPLVLLLCCCLTGIGFLVDLGNRNAAEADRRFRRGDMPGAIARWKSGSFFAPNGVVAYNCGVAYCRMGNYSAAETRFRAASGSGDGNVRQKSLYNLGSMQLQRALASEKAQASRFLNNAVKHLEESSRLNPGDADAFHNLAIARNELASLRAAVSGKPHAPEPAQASHLENGKKESEKQKREKILSGPSGKPGETSQSDNGGGKRRQVAMTRDQAQRMLNDAKGREALRSAIVRDQKNLLRASPEKDW